ncbi:MAG: deoxyribodipyrimidine photo-lyase [Caldisericia bacterium]|nr:deoxyribodipyrimidine photo-lyase [Caldisericia bacterium]
MNIEERIIKHKERKIFGGDYIIYWMSRDQRVDDNLCIIYGIELSKKYNKNFGVLFNVFPTFLDSTIRQYDFMLKGLIEVERKLGEFGIPFFLLFGDPVENILNFIKEKRVSILITDFSPLRISREIKVVLKEKLNISFYEIDTHNIIPPWITSPKLEFSAFTIRKKINKLLDKFLIEPSIINYKKSKILNRNNWDEIYKKIKVERSVSISKFFIPGEEVAKKVLKEFIENKLNGYKLYRNDPTKNYLSNLSPYLHFGMISPLRVALEVINSEKDKESKEAYLEELIIRRELAENFCFYNQNYDNHLGIPKWAKETLEKHLNDEKDFVYDIYQFENSKTHDPLWNACQKEMIITGKMHGYMRMYWAKKILEWSRDYKDAIKIAIYLNDKYELDGRDPNGYTGILWSIGGVHDRPFPERKIFGKIRYMSKNGLKKKFNIQNYIDQVSTLERIS